MKRLIATVVLVAALLGGAAFEPGLVHAQAGGPASAAIQLALRRFLATANTWTGVQTFASGTGIASPVFTGQWTVNGSLCAAGQVVQGGSPTTCTATPTLTSLALGNGTSGAPSLFFTSNTALGLWRTSVNQTDLAIESPRWWATLSTIANTFTSYPPTAYVRINADDTINGGVDIQGLQTITPGGPAISLIGQSRAQFPTYPAVAALGQYWSSNGGLGSFPATGHLFSVCFQTGNTWCDFSVGSQQAVNAPEWDIQGSGLVTHNASNAGAAIHTTSSIGYLLNNPASAVVGNQQEYSPAFAFCGAAWKTDATTASQTDCWRLENRPVNAAGATTSAFWWSSSINSSTSFTDRMSLSSAGVLAVPTLNATSKIQVNGVDVVNAQPCFNTAASNDITGTNTKTYFSVSCKIPANSLNTAGDAVKLSMRGLYSGNVTDTMTMTLEACQVSGCASGTKVTVHTAAAITLTAVSNQGFELDTQIVSFTTGAAGGHDAQGKIFYELTGTTATPDWLPNTSPITWDDTVDEYLTMSVTFSTNSASDHASIRNLVGTIQ